MVVLIEGFSFLSPFSSNNNNNLFLRSQPSQTPNWCMGPPPPSDFIGKVYCGIHTLPPYVFEHMTSQKKTTAFGLPRGFTKVESSLPMGSKAKSGLPRGILQLLRIQMTMAMTLLDPDDVLESWRCKINNCFTQNKIK